jgi:alpha-L-rhamnosidase
MDDFAPKNISEPKPGIHLVDMGQNIAGHLRITLSGATPGSQITLRYGERIDANGLLCTAVIGQHISKTDPPQSFQTDRYICKGGNETWEPRFTYHGGNYVEISGWPASAGALTAQNLRCRVHHDSWQRMGTFACSNQLLNQIYEATLWSYRSNMQSIPTDCPQREKNGWTGDAHLACEQGLYNFASATSYEKWLDDLYDEQRDDGNLPGIVPTAGWGYEWGNGPAWDSAYPLICWYLYHYTGDHRALTRHYDRLKRYVDFLTSRAKDGIIDFGLGDWLPAATETPHAVTSTAYYHVDALIVARAARLLGKTADADAYERLAADIKRAFNAAYYDAKTGSYANGSQTALSCALYQGMVEKQLNAKTFERLVEAVEAKNRHIDTGLLGAKYVLRALSEGGRVDLAYAIAAQRDFPSWGHWIEQGATTLWEDWKGEQSLNHVMFGDIVAWMYKFLAGIDIDPERPGFAHIIIKPHAVGGLTSAEADYDSVRGRIAVSWRKQGDKFSFDVTVPPGATAVVHLPITDPARVRESGAAIDKAPGVRFVRYDDPRGSDGQRALYAVGSGTYRFES